MLKYFIVFILNSIIQALTRAGVLQQSLETDGLFFLHFLRVWIYTPLNK